MGLFVKMNHIVVSLQSTSTNGTKQPSKGFRTSSSGIFRGTSTAAPHIWSFPLHVPGHCVWKPTFHPDHQLRLPLPLLPLQPVLCRHLLHLHHHPKDAAEHMERAKPSPMKAASPRCIFSYCLQGWMTSSWLWWPMIGLWLSATPCTIQSSWNTSSV